MLSGCHKSGTWSDDSRNWERAFKSTKPTDVVVVHSQYWRSAHFTYEFAYYFHIKKNDALKKQLFDGNKLKQVSGEEASLLFKDFFDKKPSWFIPNTADSYEVWTIEGESNGHFRLFIDKDSQDIFITDYQV
ncbi:MAG TPA: hypothetical protein DCZ94_07130 [Lentisphaeria bacterium]|nr:MAG: hypothetical protein A2X48_10255 [Lentisphaerae bacterium GWF2_49_21]HBC86708.1 hypothetical protein [Lentisphaeria bacterium]